MNKVAVLGPNGTFTEKAAMLYLETRGIEAELSYYATLKKTFNSIGNECIFGVIPIENTLDGFVQMILDLLTHSNLNIIHEIVLPIHFGFVANCPIEDVEYIYTQFKTQNQCNDFIEKYSHKKIITTSSNSESYEMVLNDSSRKGAIVPMHLIEGREQFATVIDNITDSFDNETRFIVLSKEINSEVSINKNWKTLLVIHDDSDRPGLLVDILNIFSAEGINLKSIISRPTKKGLGNYNFFIDVEGCYQRNEIVKRAVEKVTKEYKIRVLGSYYRVN